MLACWGGGVLGVARRADGERLRSHGKLHRDVRRHGATKAGVTPEVQVSRARGEVDVNIDHS